LIEDLIGVAGCPGCKALGEMYRKLEKRVADLEDRLNANSSNSSKAPSSDPFVARYPPKKPTGRKPGGQKGHQGHHRTLVPVGQVDEVVEHRPVVCEHCHEPLGSDSEPVLHRRHQVSELPPVAVVVTEHRSYACSCRNCGRRTAASIPPDVTRSCIGPRLSAAACYLSARVHGSRRAVQDVLTDLLGATISLGKVSKIEREMTAALVAPYEHIQRRVRKAPAKNVDETGWKRAGRWLWTAATPDAALFRIDRGRNWHGLQNLLGKKIQGVITSDRCGLYEHLKVTRRAICWAHLKRDFQRFIDRGGTGKPMGEEGMKITAALFDLWHRFRQNLIDRRGLRAGVLPLRKRMRELIGTMLRSGVSKARHFARNLKRLRPALWTFARHAGVEPTNNLAERVLRPGVMWRKTSFGSHSPDGCRYAERMMTVLTTLRLRGENVLDTLTRHLLAHRLESTA
jgi:transposase